MRRNPVVAAPPQRLVLRADIDIGDHRVTAYTRELGEDSALVETSASAQPGQRVTVHLSFPRLMEPITCQAQVVTAERPKSGRPGTWRLFLCHSTDQQRLQLRAFLLSLTEIRGGAAPIDCYRVLVVEDNAMASEVFAYGVRKYFRSRRVREVEVVTSPDGHDAWQRLSTRHYDLAIIDQYLPILTGHALIERIRADDRTADLAIIGISVDPDDARTKMLRAGADLFVPKPVVMRELFSTLERLASLHAAVTGAAR